MLRPRSRCVPLLLLLLSPLRASPAAPNATELPLPAPGNGTRTGSGLLAASGLPVLRRTVYVVSAVSVLAALYFVLRTLRWRKPQRKKYGLLPSYDERVEMASLDSDEDTVFETQSPRR
ncbi:UNVERIFIED_CONTAM: hypothetical protein H355_013582 [Colinus virginianus]|nr:hypothetical protein H355_013582 [Colinus virginianus]